MTRKIFPVAAAAAMMLAYCADAGTIMPRIGGSVFVDRNDDFNVSFGEGISGATVRLFQDNGDGIFNPDQGDTQVGQDFSTLGDGSYMFDQLDFGASYFVQRPTQQAGNMNLGNEISGLISPSMPNLMIDSFATPQGIQADTSTPIATSSVAVDPLEVLGGERDLYLELNSGFGNAKLRVSAFTDDLLQYDTTSGVRGMSIVTWDGPDRSSSKLPAMGLEDFDLTNNGQNDSILVKMGVDLTGRGDRAIFRIFEGGTDEYSEASIEFPITDGTATAFGLVSLDDFAGNVDPSRIDALQLIIGDGNKSIDAQIDYVGVVNANANHDFRVNVVPEPSSLLLVLVGLGLIAVGCYRRS